MAITKTKFIQYTRCPIYCTLEHFNDYKISSMSYEEYRKEEERERIKELLQTISEGDLIEDTASEDTLLPYYKKVEDLAGIFAKNHFDGTFIYAEKTQDQVAFQSKIHKIPYLCYVDIYNEGVAKRVIEVKATTSHAFCDLGWKKDGIFHSIFEQNKNGIYELLEEENIDYLKEESYLNQRKKLFDRYHAVGHYVYDIAVQRYFIEHSGKKEKPKEYYLAILNHQFVLGENPIEEKNEDGKEVIVYFDVTKVTEEYLSMIEEDRLRLEQYLEEQKTECPIGSYCEKKKSTKCKYISICWKNIPSKNSVFSYLEHSHGFQTQEGMKYSVWDLIQKGLTSVEDVPDSYLTREKNKIQKQVVVTGIPYIQKEKIKEGIKKITYPIYHLDFETFPCPIPRLKGESPYTQSVFQFSLHIERSPGVCDKEKDHFGYLAKDLDDHREELIQKLIEWIDTESGGTVLVYNDSFEKSRLKELAEIFPEYQTQLLKIRNMVFDLMNFTKGNQTFYESLGFPKDSLFPYYHKDMNGSFSIKKILPLFSSLSYEGMEVSNGTEAMITYASFPNLEKEEKNRKYQKLVEYCKQDTWAMVEILNGLRKL